MFRILESLLAIFTPIERPSNLMMEAHMIKATVDFL